MLHLPQPCHYGYIYTDLQENEATLKVILVLNRHSNQAVYKICIRYLSSLKSYFLIIEWFLTVFKNTIPYVNCERNFVNEAFIKLT